MKILIVSNLYPPHSIGGYELGCETVVEEFRKRGHQVNVLTSAFGVAQRCQEAQIRRWLRFDPVSSEAAPSRRMQSIMSDVANGRAFQRTVRDWRPEIVYFWNLYGIGLNFLWAADVFRIPSAIYVSDAWLALWDRGDSALSWRTHPGNSPHRRVLRRLASEALRLIGTRHPRGLPDLSGSQFASDYLRRLTAQRFHHLGNAPVVHWGVNEREFIPAQTPPASASRVLYVGQVVPHKGVHTAIQAIGILRRNGLDHVRLTIAGGTVVPGYLDDLRRLVSEQQLTDTVTFIGHVIRKRLPVVYSDHDVLVLPSIWEEPFSIALLEGMAAGLAVVCTPTGGTPESIRSGENGLFFEPGDAHSCAHQIGQLVRNPSVFVRLRDASRASIEERFTLDGLCTRLEELLLERVSRFSGARTDLPARRL